MYTRSSGAPARTATLLVEEATALDPARSDAWLKLAAMCRATSDLAGALAALKELPSEQREVLELGYFDGLSQTEIAEATGQPLGTVKTRMRLAMQKLRESLSMHRRVTE